MEKRNPWTQPDEPSAWRKLLRAMRRREGRTSMCRNSMLAFQLVPLLPIYHLVSRQTSGRAKWTHQAKQAEVEIKVERRHDVLYLILNLSLNLSLLPAGGLFQQPAKSLSDIGRSTAANDPRPSASFSAQKNPQRIPANTPPVFPGLRPCIWPHLLRLVTKAMPDRLLVSAFPPHRYIYETQSWLVCVLGDRYLLGHRRLRSERVLGEFS